MLQSFSRLHDSYNRCLDFVTAIFVNFIARFLLLRLGFTLEVKNKNNIYCFKINTHACLAVTLRILTLCSFDWNESLTYSLSTFLISPFGGSFRRTRFAAFPCTIESSERLHSFSGISTQTDTVNTVLWQYKQNLFRQSVPQMSTSRVC